MAKALLRVVGWVLVGLVGTAFVFSLMLLHVGKQVPVGIRMGGKVSDSSWDRGLVIATGTWVIENDRQAAPLQFTELICLQVDSVCRSATAEVSYGGYLAVDTDRYEIKRWTDDTITFTTSALCVDYAYTISRASARVVGTRTPKKVADGSCPSGAGKDTLQLSLKDGYVVQKALEEAARGQAQPYVWAALGCLWLFIFTRLFRRRASMGVRSGDARS